MLEEIRECMLLKDKDKKQNKKKCNFCFGLNVFIQVYMKYVESLSVSLFN